MVHAVSELQDGNKYVALEGSKAFQKVAYCATEEKRTLRYLKYIIQRENDGDNHFFPS